MDYACSTDALLAAPRILYLLADHAAAIVSAAAFSLQDVTR